METQDNPGVDQNPNPNPTPPPAPAVPPTAGDEKPAEKNIGMAIVSYIGVLIIIPFLTEAHNEAFVKFHIKQGLLVLIGWIAVSVLYAMPLGALVAWIAWLAVFGLNIVGIVNAANGKEKELPFIGHLAKTFKF